MAFYNTLLIEKGGGVIDPRELADQCQNTAAVIIGLGGQGVETLRRLKTDLRAHLRPDDPDSLIPSYQNIRFLGVDCDHSSFGPYVGNDRCDGMVELEDTECFALDTRDVRFLETELFRSRPEYSWVNKALNGFEFGGYLPRVRQVGRFLLLHKAYEFAQRLEREIEAARYGLIDPSVNIHIITGLADNMGSGCFLDVCYLARYVLYRHCCGTVFGYFYLPDVTLARIPMGDTGSRNYNMANGYAALQELDYCMQLRSNGGGFTQLYPGGLQVPWKEPPVDLCYLIGATDEQGHIRESSHAIETVSGYLLAHLTDQDYSLEMIHSNHVHYIIVGQSRSNIGACLNYCSIGVDGAAVPLKEINNYLAAELFHQFSKIGQNLPTRGDVEAMAVDALAPGAGNVSDIYGRLHQELCEGFELNYAPYLQDWRYVRDAGNHDMVRHYTDQNAEKLNLAERNARAMMDGENRRSLIFRIRKVLNDLIRNMDYGPMYAYQMLSTTRHHNLVNIIDGLIEENHHRWDQEQAQTGLRQSNYDNSLADFEHRRSRRLMDTDKKRFNDYNWCMQYLLQHQLELELYGKLDTILNTLRKQVMDAADSYYRKLARVMHNLLDTFQENRAYLDFLKAHPDPRHLPNLGQLEPKLQQTLQGFNIPGVFHGFMDLLLREEQVWLAENEWKLHRLVQDFLCSTVFPGRYMGEYLRDWFGAPDDTILAQRLEQAVMWPLAARTVPGVPLNPAVWNSADCHEMKLLLVPDGMHAADAAAEQLNQSDPRWRKVRSARTDRIGTIRVTSAFPLWAVQGMEQYELTVMHRGNYGRYSYEGPQMDWRKLPSLCPQSMMNLNWVPEWRAQQVREALDLYGEARRLGLIDDSGQLCEPDEEALMHLQALMTEIRGDYSRDFRERYEALRQAMDVPLVPGPYRLDAQGYSPEAVERKRTDQFVSAPALQKRVRGCVEQLAPVAEAEALLLRAEAREKHENAYLEALFTGVIAVNGHRLSWTDGVGLEHCLSSRSVEFPWANIPVYQGFLSYQALPGEARETIRLAVVDRFETEQPIADLDSICPEREMRRWRELAEALPAQECADVLAFLEALWHKRQCLAMEYNL